MKDVAAAVLVQPLTSTMHNKPMSEAVMRVRVTEVVPEFRGIDPPFQSLGADEHMVLGECPAWMMEWPKSQIRLGECLQGIRRTGGATSKPPPPPVRPSSRRPQKDVVDEPQKEKPVAATTAGRKVPTVVAATSRHQKLLGTYVPPQSKVSSDFPTFRLHNFPNFRLYI